MIAQSYAGKAHPYLHNSRYVNGTGGSHARQNRLREPGWRNGRREQSTGHFLEMGSDFGNVGEAPHKRSGIRSFFGLVVLRAAVTKT
jgi:hypothetical protein